MNPHSNVNGQKSESLLPPPHKNPKPLQSKNESNPRIKIKSLPWPPPPIKVNPPQSPDLLSTGDRSTPRTPLVPDVYPPPKPPAILQVLAFGFIVFLACLQFLPASHFRDPNDRLRNWIPFDHNGTVNSKNAEFEKIHVFSWTDCLDLRMLAVLVSSTLSSSSLKLSHSEFK